MIQLFFKQFELETTFDLLFIAPYLNKFKLLKLFLALSAGLDLAFILYLNLQKKYLNLQFNLGLKLVFSLVRFDFFKMALCAVWWQAGEACNSLFPGPSVGHHHPAGQRKIV